MAAVEELTNKIITVKIVLACAVDPFVLASISNYVSARAMLLMNLEAETIANEITLSAIIQIRTYQNKLLQADLSRLKRVRSVLFEMQNEE